MKYIKPGKISGAINAPPSKSMMQRALILAALAHGESRLTNPSFCDDSLATINVIKTLGAQVDVGKESVTIRGGGEPTGGKLDCGESGTCMRMISAVAALYGKKFTITGKKSLLSRPVGMIEQPLLDLRAECTTNNGLPPIVVKGPMKGGKVRVDGSLSSQFVSGLLMALPLCENDSEVEVIDLKSRAYVGMTESLVSLFGGRIESRGGHFLVQGNMRYRARDMEIEGDWSGAAFMLVAGAIAGSVKVRLKDSLQPDQEVMKALGDAGAEIRIDDDCVEIKSTGLRAFDFDATESPDLFPPLAVLACSCEGKSVIRGASRLRHKESDRAAVLMEELGKLGADIKVEGDRMLITGKKLAGGRMNPHGDHRIAMAGAIAALNSEKGVEIEDEGCVSKSYPGFFDDLESLMVKK